MELKVGDIFYRYRDQTYAPSVDEFDNVYGKGELRIHCDEYIAKKVTKLSVLLAQLLGGFEGHEQRWMRIEARNVFAASTKKAALYHFIKRKKKQASIYRARLESALDAERKANSLMEKE